MKKFKVSTRKTELHNLWSLVVRTRDRFICQWCRKEEHPANAHHIVTKGSAGNSGSYEIENGMTLCVYCHRNRVPCDPDEYIAVRDKWLKDKGLDFWELKAKYDETAPHFTEDFFAIKKKVLEDILNNLTRRSSF